MKNLNFIISISILFLLFSCELFETTNINSSDPIILTEEMLLDSIRSTYTSMLDSNQKLDFSEILQKTSLNVSEVMSEEALRKLEKEISMDGRVAEEFVEDNIQNIYDFKKCKARDTGRKSAERVRANNYRLPQDSIRIPIVFHLITTTSGLGNITSEMIQQQVKTLNDNFAKTLFSFTLSSVDTTVNDNWYYKVDQDNNFEKEMFSAIEVSRNTTLNVYSLGNKSYLGYAQFPWKVEKTFFDGVVINNQTLPGGSMKEYNQGKTLTHEVGHYLGLWHTFHGGDLKDGCIVGDNINDTPSQRTSTNGCPVGKDTCEENGFDPINNYMDYSYDSCMNEFTSGQGIRMNWVTRKYRSGFIPETIVQHDN